MKTVNIQYKWLWSNKYHVAGFIVVEMLAAA